MSLKIVTNNPKVCNYCTDNEYACDFFPEHAKDLLFRVREYIMEGFYLAADPLGGYLSRPNPYHSVFLLTSSAGEPRSKDILRIETAINQWYKYGNVIEMTDLLRSQYEELDFSIATNTLMGLSRNPLLF